MTHTIEKLGAMTPEQLTLAMDRLVDSLFGDAKNTADTVAQALGVTRQTYFRWRRTHSVPCHIILLLQEWDTSIIKDVGAEQWHETIKGLQSLTQDMQSISDGLAALSAGLTTLAKYHAAVPTHYDADGTGPYPAYQRSS